MSKNHYEEKISHVQNLIRDGEFKMAYDILDEELKMPYVPKIYETIFIELMNDIKVELIGEPATHIVPREIAMDYLISGNPEKEIMSLEMLRAHNLRYEIDTIKEVVEKWDDSKRMLKAYMFEILAEQEIDVDITISGIEMNPKKHGSIFDKEEVVQTMELIPTFFEKNPSAAAAAIDQFQQFILITYPGIPTSPQEFAFNISQVVKSLFEEVKLTDTQLQMKNLLEQTN